MCVFSRRFGNYAQDEKGLFPRYSGSTSHIRQREETVKIKATSEGAGSLCFRRDEQVSEFRIASDLKLE
jgi:hypothetical protein